MTFSRGRTEQQVTDRRWTLQLRWIHANPSSSENCCRDYGWPFNILAPDLANRSRWSPLRNWVQLHVGIFLRMCVAGVKTCRQLAFLRTQMNRSIACVWCGGSPLTPKQCSFFNQWLPTLNVLKYGNVMLPVFVLQCSAMSINIVMGSAVEMRRFSPCFPHSHVFQKTWQATWLFTLSSIWRFDQKELLYIYYFICLLCVYVVIYCNVPTLYKRCCPICRDDFNRNRKSNTNHHLVNRKWILTHKQIVIWAFHWRQEVCFSKPLKILSIFNTLKKQKKLSHHWYIFVESCVDVFLNVFRGHSP